MNRNQKSIYSFIYDRNKKFYRANQSMDGGWTVSFNSEMFPISFNPKNLDGTPVEFGTNKEYFSMNRSINYPLDFVFDGAAILNYKYNNGKGFNEELYFAMIEFDPTNGKFKISYNGRFDFQQKDRDEKLGVFSVPVVDDSAWGVLSQNDDVKFFVDCNKYNPKAIKVLFSDVVLRNRYTFQTVQAPIVHTDINNVYTIPFVLVNQDGDSSGIISKSQSYGSSNDQATLGPIGVPPHEAITFGPNFFLGTFYDLPGVNIQGSIQFEWGTDTLPGGGIYIVFRTNKGQFKLIWTNQIVAPDFPTLNDLVVGQIYTVAFNFNIDLTAGENIFFLVELDDAGERHFQITPIVTNIFVSTVSTIEPAVCYGLRPLDLVKDLVEKATFGRYTINSNYFEVNNKTVLVSGESLRGIDNAKIYSSFKDFFQSFDFEFFMAMRNIKGDIFIELADEVYDNQTSTLIDLGEIIEFKTSPAVDYIPNEIQVGSPKQDYRHPSGRLEFNDTKGWSLPFQNVKNKATWVTKYRTDPYGAIFMILDYRGQSTKDNSGDNDTWMIQITDEQGSANQDIETFENITIDNAVLAPIIKYPLTGDVINNDKPFLTGVGIPGTNVNIYIGDVLDGGTVVAGDGTWSYNITTSLPSYDPGVFDGVVIINATNTDMLGVLNTIQLVINTIAVPNIQFTNPRTGDNIFNNLPLISGSAPAGTNIDIYLDGVLLASVVTDNSCRFFFKVVTPLTNGVHVLRIGLTGDLVSITVNAFTSKPIITYVEGELDGFPIVNNLPLIKGVGIPGTTFSLFLNYIPYSPLAVITVDPFGDWSFQVVPITYIDPVTLGAVILSPIRNGLSVISTQLINEVVQVAVTGFKLDRPAFDSITGVPDNTIFNTYLSPKRMLLRRKSWLASIMNKQRTDFIKFQVPDKNANLATVLGTEVVIERADIGFSSLGEPLAILEIAHIKVIAQKSFQETLYDFNNGGVVTGKWKGNQVYMLPIGKMQMKSIMDSTQEWSLLMSPRMTYMQLLNLYRNGLTINLMDNAIYHSDYNSLHFVTYDFTQNPAFNFMEIYDEVFNLRNSAWSQGETGYRQKFQTTESFKDQIITAGISSVELLAYKCSTGLLYRTIPYVVVSPAPIPVPEIVLEAPVDLSTFDANESYFFVQAVDGTPVAISEKIFLKVKHDKTIRMIASHSVNLPGVFFSTGFRTVTRVEGLIKKYQPDTVVNVANEESGNKRLLYSKVALKRMIRFGTARGLPDYLMVRMALGVTMDNCDIENVLYALQDGEEIKPSDDIDGVPLYYYEMIMNPVDNSRGKVFPGAGDANVSGVILVVDASAIGIPTEQIIMIDEEGE